MLELIQRLMDEKKEYRCQLARVEKLPEDYRFVFEKIHDYIWSFADGDGSDMLETQGEMILLFEESAAEGRHILEVTGKDVAAFCDELLRDTKKWTDAPRNRLNRKIAQNNRD